VYKTITSLAAKDFDQQLNDAEKDGFVLIHISVAMASYRERDYTALMHKPDTAPVPRTTTEQLPAEKTTMERLADTADNVLREEARQYAELVDEKSNLVSGFLK